MATTPIRIDQNRRCHSGVTVLPPEASMSTTRAPGVGRSASTGAAVPGFCGAGCGMRKSGASGRPALAAAAMCSALPARTPTGFRRWARNSCTRRSKSSVAAVDSAGSVARSITSKSLEKNSGMSP